MPEATVTPIATRRAARLLLETPLASVLEEMSADLERQRRIEPNGGARHALEHYVARWTAALADAANAEVWLDVAEVARLRGCSPQAVRKACKVGRLVCRKTNGVWEVHKDSALDDTRRAG